MNPVPLFLIIVSLPLLLGGCGETEEVDPNLKYEIKSYGGTLKAVTITGCNRGVSGELVIPDTIEGNPVTSIGERAFQSCHSLSSVTFGTSSKLISIGGQAFQSCTSLTSITIPNGVTSIGDWAFHDCTSLMSITIPNGVTSIKEYAFKNCTGLASITLPDGVTSIGDVAFKNCTGLASITIPDGVTSIGMLAFANCASLTSVMIPASVASIESGAFGVCRSLTAVTFLGDAPKKGAWPFTGTQITIYRNPEAKGWGETFAGRPVKLISEKP